MITSIVSVLLELYYMLQLVLQLYNRLTCLKLNGCITDVTVSSSKGGGVNVFPVFGKLIVIFYQFNYSTFWWFSCGMFLRCKEPSQYNNIKFGIELIRPCPYIIMFGLQLPSKQDDYPIRVGETHFEIKT